jgi:hypothetical protein
LLGEDAADVPESERTVEQKRTKVSTGLSFAFKGGRALAVKIERPRRLDGIAV